MCSQGEEGQPKSPSGPPDNKPAAAAAAAAAPTERRRDSPPQQKGRNSAGSGRAKSTTSASESESPPPPAAATRASSGSTTPRKLERSDTSFASVDISDITELDEEKQRSPSPQPTFDDGPPFAAAQVGPRTDHGLSPPASPASPKSPEPSLSGARASPVRRRQKSAWADSREVPGDSAESRTSPLPPPPPPRPGSGRSAPGSPVIKKLQPAYLEVPHIVATNYRYSAYTYFLRSKSVPDISSTAAAAAGPVTSDNSADHDSSRPPRGLRKAPGSCRERTRKRRSIPAGQSLSLAQRVCLARRVESYIASSQSQVKWICIDSIFVLQI